MYRTRANCFNILVRASLSMTSMMSKEPRRFAPLGQGTQKVTHNLPTLKGIVFDVDGTLCLQQNYMFGEMRRALNIDKSTDILDHCHSLPAPDQEEALEKIRNIERAAMTKQEPQPGLVALMDYLESRGLKRGICTRNFETPVAHLLGKFLPGKEFHPIVTRDFRPPKPDPAGILHIAKTWGHFKVVNGKEVGDASDIIMVGDSIDDMAAGHRAKAATVLVVTETNAHLATHEHTDLIISRLDELIDILENGFVGRIGRGDEFSDTGKRAEEVLKKGEAEGPS